MSPEAEAERLSHSEVWDERYAKAKPSEKPAYEWYLDFKSLEPFFAKHLYEAKQPQTCSKILHLGSGESTIPYDLLEYGYEDQTCIDFSSVVVQLMKTRHSNQRIQWMIGDVRDMPSVLPKTIDVAFDKGTLDAMIHGSPWSPPSDVMENTGKYLKEISRVLRNDGVFLYITFRQPHFVKPILNRDGEWDLQTEAFGDSGAFEYFGYILRKPQRIIAADENTT